MVKYLQRLKCKKGFTLVELVVAIAIIAVLTAIILVNALGGNTDAILSAKSSAEAFFTATQLTLTRAQLTERSLVEYEDTDTKFIEYKNGINVTNDDKYLFIEVRCDQNGVIGAHIDNTFNALMSKGDITDDMTALESYIAQNLDKYLYESYDGYFYAVADNNFKVLFTHFCRSRLPQYSGGSLTDFRDSMMISNDRVVGNEEIIGSCSDVYSIAVTGDYVFALPDISSAEYDKYLA